MKKVVIIVAFSIFVIFTVQAQDKKTVIENRCKEIIRVICLNEKDQWRKFIKENCTETWINKKMRAQIQGGPDGSAQTATNDELANLEAKVQLFQRLHDDMGKGTISNLKVDGDNAEVQVKGETGLDLTLGLKFIPNAPYLIDGLSVQAMMGGPRN
ncbi:MAG: hypothetical protein JNK18_09315 [Cyclobacteriaceae bacterium]|nr:hypothetical protein [Cyclobacteriaceae bacterium]